MIVGMSYDDAYGGGWDDYGYGDYDPNAGETPWMDDSDMIEPWFDKKDQRRMEIFMQKHNGIDAKKVEYLRKVMPDLVEYELNKGFVKARPFAKEMRELDIKIGYLTKLLESDEFKARSDAEEERPLIEKEIRDLDRNRTLQELSYNRIISYQRGMANDIRMHVENHIRQCDSEDPKYLPNYIPEKDHQIKMRLKESEQYRKEVSELKRRDEKFEKLRDKIDRLCEEFGSKIVRDEIETCFKPYVWKYKKDQV